MIDPSLSFEYKVTLGNLIVFGTIIVGLTPIWIVCRAAYRVMHTFAEEHDVMWEDYNVRHQLPWRRKFGRVEEPIKARAAGVGR